MNIKGPSCPKCGIVCRVLRENNIEVTHVENETDLKVRVKYQVYICVIYFHSNMENIHNITVKRAEFTIGNISKPPLVQCPPKVLDQLLIWLFIWEFSIVITQCEDITALTRTLKCS